MEKDARNGASILVTHELRQKYVLSPKQEGRHLGNCNYIQRKAAMRMNRLWAGRAKLESCETNGPMVRQRLVPFESVKSKAKEGRETT